MQDSYVDQYGRSLFRYRPRKDSLDQECDDLIWIARKAQKHCDVETLEKVRMRGDEFFLRHPEYKHSCWNTSFVNAVK